MMIISLFVLFLISQSLHSYSQPPPRPNVDETAAFARWLIAAAEWGVVCTNNRTAPFGNVVSYSGETGIPYLYLSALDPTADFSRIDPRASFTVSEAELGDCAGKDPQSPLCSKITLSGELLNLDDMSEEGKFGKEAFFRRHPNFDNIFPGLTNTTFTVFKLIPTRIFLVNKAAPPASPSVADYLAVNGTI